MSKSIDNHVDAYEPPGALKGTLGRKRSYQSTLGKSIIIAALAFLIPAGGCSLYSQFKHKREEIIQKPKVVRYMEITQLGSPPAVSQTQTPQLAVAQPKIAKATKVGIPKAVPDHEAPEEVTIATQAELGELSDLTVGGLGGGGDSIVFEAPQEEYLPPPDKFVPTDELPVPINPGMPPYPELARKAGIEGTVWIKALVNKHGKVLDAIVLKESGAKAGFEEAALQHAHNINYKPAISNKQAIAVWVAYPVHFRLGK